MVTGQRPEIARLRRAYERRDRRLEREGVSRREAEFLRRQRRECKRIWSRVLREHFPDLERVRLLEVGAGHGENLDAFQRMGLRSENTWANELLESRFAALRRRLPVTHLLPGDALDIDEDRSWDVVVASLVFTSILEDSFRRALAEKLLRLTAPGGLVLCYDFWCDNPRNADVRGLPRRDVRQLFRGAGAIEFRSVTLAPPIARRIGPLWRVTSALCPFLRTHWIAAIPRDPHAKPRGPA